MTDTTQQEEIKRNAKLVFDAVYGKTMPEQKKVISEMVNLGFLTQELADGALEVCAVNHPTKQITKEQ